MLQPDVFVFPPIDREIERPSWRDITSLLLAIEVMSPTSVRTDRVQKRDQYMRMSVDEYWVVDLEGRHVERWFHGQPGVSVARDTLDWRPRAALAPLTIDLQALWKAIGLKRLF